MMRVFVLLGLLGLLGSAWALENPGPDLEAERATSSAKEISLKPLFLFSMRDRRDPFTYDISDADALGANRDFSISALKLAGFIGEGNGRVALFQNIWNSTTYKFRAGHLYTDAGGLVADVSGDIVSGDRVHLLQGESSIIFNMNENSRMGALATGRRHFRKQREAQEESARAAGVDGGHDAGDAGQDASTGDTSDNNSSAPQKGAP